MAHSLRLHTARIRAVALAIVLATGGCGDVVDSTEPVTAPQVPVERIVSLNPALTETLVAIGAGDTLVGIGRWDPEVPGRPGVPRLGDAFSVSLEAVAALDPDVVLVNGIGLAERLAPLRNSTYVEVLATDRLGDVLAAIERLGELTDRPLSARGVSDRLRASLTSARARAAERAQTSPRRSPRVLVAVQRDPLYVAGGGSYIHELLIAVGAENVVGDLADAWPVLSEESLVARAPDVILDATAVDAGAETGTAAAAARWSGLSTVPAVRDGRVLPLGENSEALFRAGPRLPEAIRILETLLFSETPKDERGSEKRPGSEKPR